VRELQNVIERAVILADTDELTAGELEESIVSTAPAAVLQGGDAAGGPLSIEDYIKDVVLRYQESCSESKLAAMLGIGRKALWMRRKSWGLFREGGRAPAPASPPEAASPARAGREGEVR